LSEVASHRMVFWSLSLGLFRGNAPAFQELLLHTPRESLSNLIVIVNIHLWIIILLKDKIVEESSLYQ